MKFDSRTRDGNTRDENVLKIYYKKRASLEFGLVAHLLTENANDLCERLRVGIQDKKK